MRPIPSLIFLALSLAYASGATAPIPLQIATQAAPPGGWTQIQIYASKPTAIASGDLALDLDATVFGPGATVGLFGANGDAAGLAIVNGSQIEIRFSSPTGGIGQLAGVPVVVITAPVLASAAGRTVTITATSPDSSLTIASGSLTVQGTLSVEKIPAGMGVVPAGTVVPVYGAGFTPSTTIAIDGVAIASAAFVSAGEIDVTLGGATELVGKLARVRDGGAEFDYFCFQPNAPLNFPESTNIGSAVANVQPLFPLVAMTGSEGFSDYGDAIEVENPNSRAATVTITEVDACCGPLNTASQQILSIPAGSWAIFDGGGNRQFVTTSDLPVREIALALGLCSACVTLDTTIFFDANALAPTPMSPASLTFAWQTGSSTLPAARTVSLALTSLPQPMVMATTASGGSWLSVSTVALASGIISVSVNPSQLAAGTYQGSISVTEPYGPAVTLPVSLTVTAAPVPVISANPASLSFNTPAFNAAVPAQTIALTSNIGPAAFSVTLPANTWLAVSPMSGTTPATLTVTTNPAVTSQNYYSQGFIPSSILISSPGNAVTIAATLNVTGVQTFSTSGGVGPTSLVFSAQTASAAQTQTVYVDPQGAISATADQPWINASTPATGLYVGQAVTVTVNPAGLAAGNYSGTVTIAEPGLASAVVPVSLSVWSTAPTLTISPGSFTFVQGLGEPPLPQIQTAEVQSGSVPLPLTILLGASWLTVVDQYSALTPTPLEAIIIGPQQAPGQYNGSFTVQSPGGSVYVPVTLLIEPDATVPPVVSAVVNAASGIPGGVSPGEIVSIRGYGAGAAAIGSLQLDASGNVASALNGLQVTFDGKAAPLTYTSVTQTNLVVPYETANQGTTSMQVTYQSAAGALQTAAWMLPVVASAPGIFTIDATGTGQAAVVNQDSTINSAQNPAARGSVISIYATGEGQTSPAGVTGSVTHSTVTPVLPVTVKIGGVAAVVQFAGSAPGEVAGVFQVNAVVPPSVTPGSAVPVILSVGDIPSQTATMAVK